MTRTPGDKLGPRLSQLFLQHQVALRRQLAPVEAHIAAAGTQKVIDRAGLEVAEFYRPIINAALKDGEGVPPVVREMLEQTAAGTHQWQALAGGLAISGASSALGTIFNNYLADISYAYVGLNPHLKPDIGTIAGLAARGIRNIDQGATDAAELGYNVGWWQMLFEAAQTMPDAASMFQVVNRGYLPEAELDNVLQRAGIPATYAAAIRNLRFQVLAPADAALAVLRGNMTLAAGNAVAAANGLSAHDFDILIGNTGEPPAPEELLMLHRRGKITTPRLERGIRQSRIRNEWIPEMLMLAVAPPSSADVLESLVQGEVTLAEARTRYEQAGGDPTWFDVARATTANSPAPVELAVMANRGIIPWSGRGRDAVTWEQGFLEGRWKDKWKDAYRKLAAYQPPPREIATLVREGGLTQDQALKLWEAHGLSPELAHIYWTAAHYQRTSKAHELAQAEIIRLYTDKAITRAQCSAMLESVGWTKTDAAWLIDIADLQQARTLLEKALSKISALYIAWKITDATARKAMADLGIVATEVNEKLKVWALERGANVKVLTAAEIADAFHYSLMDVNEAMAELEAIGYTPRDAWYVLAIKEHSASIGIPKPA